MEWPFVRLRYPLWIVVVVLLFVMNMRGSESCLEEERLGLLELKTFLNSNSSSDVLPSWVDDSDEADCCAWEHVKCNHTTKHVMDLLLGDGAIFMADVWLMNFSYFAPFKQLARLGLSDNFFHGWSDIEGLCGMKTLQELDLSRNMFTGNLPQCLGHLTGLRVLDLSSNAFTGSVPSFINSLKSLEYLSLFDNNFDGSFSFSSLSNHSKLEVFLLSPTSNNLPVETSNTLHVETENPSWLPKFQLRVLQLRNCNLNSKRNGTIPSFLLYQHELRLIDLSHNKLAGEFPSWLLQNNTKLETFYLMNNSFTGTLEVPIFKHALLDLQISNNKIGGQLPDNIGEIFPTLFYVNLSGNSFEGTLPSSMSEMQTIRTMDLSYNNFSGELTGHLFSNLTSLILLRLSHNSFHGPVIPMFSNLTTLRWLYLDHNSFSGEIEYGVSDKSFLSTLDISNNMIYGRIPSWISSIEFLSVLSLSKNQLEGGFPDELCSLSSLTYLDLSENSLSGSLPSCFKNLSLKFLYLQKNALQGYIPDALSEHTHLASLDLRDNKFFGKIPHWINRLSRLRVLLLAGNYLTGIIPIETCQLEHVKIMDLSRNRLTGAIPSCFNNISFQMKENHGLGLASTIGKHCSNDTLLYYSSNIDSIFLVYQIWFVPGNTFHTFYNCTLSLNHLVGDEYKISYEQTEVEFRAKNNYHTYKGNILDLMTGLDLSSNELSGNIPPEIGELREIFALNLSHNRLSGYIPGSISNLTSIESLDLSYNNLSGGIPLNLTELYSLAIFNVSYNNLSGMVPITGQFATFDENNYRGNSYLCGETLNISCTSTSSSPPTHANESAEDHTAIDMGSFYWSFFASYVTVVLGLAVVLWVNSHWCRAWFHFVDLCIFSCFSRCLRNAFH